MLDPQLLRTEPEEVAAALKQRGYDLDVAAWRELESRRKELQIRVEELQNQKNQSAKSIGQAKARGE
ncbi:MAG: serine--tRNA ligase, partial [Xanthomonadales bacterium]